MPGRALLTRLDEFDRDAAYLIICEHGVRSRRALERMRAAGFSAVAGIPLVSLPCNIVVAGTGFLRFARRDLVPTRELATVCLASVPAAYLGGRLPVPRGVFLLTLGGLLVLAGGAVGTTIALHPSSRLLIRAGTAALLALAARPLVVGGVI